MFSDIACYVTIVVIAVLGLVYTAVIAFQQRLSIEIPKKIVIINTNKDEIDQGAEEIYIMHKQQQNYYQGVTDHIYNASFNLFYIQSINMIFFAMFFAVFFLIWLTVYNHTFYLMLSFIIGCLSVSINTLITLQLSITSLVKLIIQEKDKNLFSFAYLTSSAISISVVSVVMILFITIMPSYEASMLSDGENTVEDYTTYTRCLLGFGLGNAYATLFYREAGCLSSKGILVGCDLIVRSNYSNDEQNRIKMNLDMASIISNIYSNCIVSVLDFQIVFVAFICSFVILTAQSAEVNETSTATYYMPLFFMALNLIVAICLSFASLVKMNESEGVGHFTAKQIRVQLIACNVVSIVFFILFPRYLMPEDFSIGDENQHVYSHLSINRPDTIWCLLAGLFTQVTLIGYSEIMTSHYYYPVKQIAIKGDKQNKIGFALSVLTANYFANISQHVIMVMICIMCLFGYILAGFFGIACCALGFLSGPFALMSANIFACITAESFKMSQIGCVFNDARELVYKISWAARNYSIFIQIVVVIGALLANIVGVGAALIISQEHDIYIWDAYGLCGFLYGGGLVYFIRGISQYAVKKNSLQLKSDYDLTSEITYESNLKKLGTLVDSQYQQMIRKIAINIIVALFSVVFIGVLLGSKCIISFLIGFNLVGIYMCFMSLIIGYSLKNSREYNKNVGEVCEGFEAPIQADIVAMTVESVPGINLLTYIVLVTLFCILGSKYWPKYGFLRKWADVDRGISQLAQGSTGWVDEGLGNLGEDGENEG